MSSQITSLNTHFYHYVQTPVASMREKPTLNSKVVSQALLSEPVRCLDEHSSWILVMTSDGYSGWIEKNSLVSLREPYNSTHLISRLKAHIYEVDDIEFGPVCSLPYGVCIHVVQQHNERWMNVKLPSGKDCFIQKGDIALQETLTKKEELVPFSQKFLGLPYTWGGRSSFGYDCSGFIQMLYKKIHIDLPRDSHQQINVSCLCNCNPENLQPGDLIFFGKSENQIKHVGLFLGNRQFIHATSRENQPWIRISSIDDFEWSGQEGAYYPFCIGRKLIEN